MGEDATVHLGRRGGGHPGRSDKDRSQSLKEVPGLARPLILDCARALGHEALVVLLVDYYVRPGQAVGSSLDDDGLVVDGFTRPIPVAPDDRPLLEEWLTRRRRLRTAASVYTFLAGPLRGAVAERLAQIERDGGPESPWRGQLRTGVRELRRWARERFVEVAAGDDAIYHELCHDERTQLAEGLYLSLNARARRTIDAVMASEAAGIERALSDTAKSALAVIGS